MRHVFVLLLLSAVVSTAQESVSGRWIGSIKITDRELKLVVDVAQPEKDHWIGSMTSPDLNIKGAVLTDIAVKDSSVSFATANAGPVGLEAKFTASLTATDKMQGNFLQGGNTAPFALTKTGPAQVEPLPRSTTILAEFVGEWKGDYELFGYPRHVTIKLANHDDAATADFVIVGKKNNILPVDLVEQTGNRISLDSHQAGITFEGRLNKATNEINGTLTQGPIELSLTVRRTQ
jgi:hypothetical protein